MAGFESTRIAPVVEAAREWKVGRFAPLYAAGILAGVGLGIGVATWPGGAAGTRDHVAAAPVEAHIVDEAPVAAPPLFAINPAAGVNSPALVELPIEFNAAVAGWVVPAPPIAVAPEAPAPAPAAAAPAVPVAQAPAKPAPAVQPQPAPQVQPAPAPATAEKPNFYVPTVSSGGPTSMELGLFNLINAERAKEGLAPYVLEAGLTKVARTRSQQMIDQNYFGHRDPYGYSMYVELLAYFGYTSYAWAGENLAMNNWPVATAGDEAIRGLMASPTHRANIMATDFTRIGLGEVTAADGRHFYAMIFLS
ncbi:MAG: CAP domain-containing protein [Dehalococcoidia bacterium]|jgi:uncharacterized protein YkwD